jgi:hypothetical protein
MSEFVAIPPSSRPLSTDFKGAHHRQSWYTAHIHHRSSASNSVRSRNEVDKTFLKQTREAKTRFESKGIAALLEKKGMKRSRARNKSQSSRYNHFDQQIDQQEQYQPQHQQQHQQQHQPYCYPNHQPVHRANFTTTRRKGFGKLHHSTNGSSPQNDLGTMLLQRLKRKHQKPVYVPTLEEIVQHMVEEEKLNKSLSPPRDVYNIAHNDVNNSNAQNSISVNNDLHRLHAPPPSLSPPPPTNSSDNSQPDVDVINNTNFTSKLPSYKLQQLHESLHYSSSTKVAETSTNTTAPINVSTATKIPPRSNLFGQPETPPPPPPGPPPPLEDSHQSPRQPQKLFSMMTPEELAAKFQELEKERISIFQNIDKGVITGGQ